jgi:hypothetical protein
MGDGMGGIVCFFVLVLLRRRAVNYDAMIVHDSFFSTLLSGSFVFPHGCSRFNSKVNRSINICWAGRCAATVCVAYLRSPRSSKSAVVYTSIQT